MTFAAICWMVGTPLLGQSGDMFPTQQEKGLRDQR